MNEEQHLLTILIEECAELQQAATKIQRFGADSRNNKDNLQEEFNQLLAVAKILDAESDLDLWESQKIMNQKIEKVEHYRQISKKLGLLKDEN